MRTNILRGLAIAAFVVVGLGGCALPASAESYGNPNLLIETDVLAGLIDGRQVTVIDVRPRENYDAGHIPGAVHLAADDVIDANSMVEGSLLAPQILAGMLGQRGVDKSTSVVFYDDKGGFHAARLFWLLEYFGHRQVGVLNGGYPKWQAEGRRVSRTEPEAQAKIFSFTETPRRQATADWLLERRDDTSVVVIDVRPEELHQAGHIPWAKSIPWKLNLAQDGTMKPAAELRRHFVANGVTPDKNVAVHCQNGKAAAHTYFTLRLLGYPRVRSYDRSWAEWGPADDLPKTLPAGQQG